MPAAVVEACAEVEGGGIQQEGPYEPPPPRRQVSKKPLLSKEIDAAQVTASWKRTVYADPDLPQSAVDRDAYVVCVLKHLSRALTIRTCSPRRRCAGPTRAYAQLLAATVTDPEAAELLRQRFPEGRRELIRQM